MKGVRGILIFLCLGAILSGCAITGQEACMDMWKERHPNYTDDQRLVLFYGSKGIGCIPEWLFTLDKDGIPQIAYQKIKLDKILEVDTKQLKGLDDVLNPKDLSWYKLLVEMGLRPLFEEKERAQKYRVARLQLKLNHEVFRRLMGEAGEVPNNHNSAGYDIRIFLPDFNPEKETPFRVKEIEEAKRDGKLVLIGVTMVYDYEMLGKKEQDIEYPQDTNRFIWKRKVEGIEVKLYKIIGSNQPSDKRANYLEATRVVHELDKDGNTTAMRRESHPALRVFTSPSQQLDVIVLDTDKEGELGFGLPDIVEKLVTGITTGKELILQNQSLIAKLFEEKVTERRQIPPPPKEQKFNAVSAGTKIDPWEKSANPNGWPISLDYKSDKKDNYKIEVVLKLLKSGETSGLRHIDYIKKIYHVAGKPWQSVKGEVAEYYRPSKSYDAPDILEINVDLSNKKKVTIEREGQSSVSGIISSGKNAFIEEQPFRIDYSEGETRWRLEDRERVGKFMYRMEVSKNSGNSNTGPDSSLMQ